MSSPYSQGVQAFMNGLQQCGLQWTVNGDVLLFPLTAIVGGCQGEPVQTGVAIGELDAWPMAPPHWVHLPAGILVGPTNSKPSPIGGWLMHSRNAPSWGNARHPVQAWLAHVQSVLDVAEAA